MGLFGPSKQVRQIADIEIGPNIHNQILSAKEENELLTGKNLAEPYATSYIIGYTCKKYQMNGLNGEKSLNQIASHLLNRIIPNQLEQIFDRNCEAAKLAKSLGQEDFMSGWVKGAKDGLADAEAVEAPKLLRQFLISQ